MSRSRWNVTDRVLVGLTSETHASQGVVGRSGTLLDDGELNFSIGTAMNQEDFKFIETKLDVVLPDVFKERMRRLPNDPGHQLVWGESRLTVLPTNAELFAIAQLRKFNSEPRFDYYEIQPELRQRRFLNVGHEGNGDFYCMVGDDASSRELWVWRHDSYENPIFVSCPDRNLLELRERGWKLGTTLDSFLELGWNLTTQPDPFAELPSRNSRICRANHPLRSIFDPIGLQEWRDYVGQDPQFELDEMFEFENPFTRKMMCVDRWPGRVIWNLGSSTTHISYECGCLALPTHAAANLTDAQIQTLVQTARNLNASLL